LFAVCFFDLLFDIGIWNNMNTDNTDSLLKLAGDLYENNIIRFGEFKLRSGETSKIYFDLRRSITYPYLIESIAREYVNLLNCCYLVPKSLKDTRFDPSDNHRDTVRVCGIAYTGIPIATAISQIANMPMIMKRKEAKDYGTKQLIEGHFEKGDKVILIDDVITSGGSIIETITELENAGLVIGCVLVLTDRRPIESGRPGLLNGKYPLFSVYNMEGFLRKIKQYCRKSVYSTPIPSNIFARPSFNYRSQFAGSKVGVRLMETMERKRSNLVLSADVVTSAELLGLADLVGPEICMIKTHMDILVDFDYDKVVGGLLALAKKHDFLIMEDRKFADIGNTVIHQYTGGLYRISEWADLVTVHGLLGEGIVSAFSSVCREDRGILLLAQLSNKGNLIDQEYTKQCVSLAEKYPKLVAGLICGERLSDNDGLLHLTPGVNITTDSDNLDQRYHDPNWVINELESDIVIVGRGIYQSKDPLKSAQLYRNSAWFNGGL